MFTYIVSSLLNIFSFTHEEDTCQQFLADYTIGQECTYNRFVFYNVVYHFNCEPLSMKYVWLLHTGRRYLTWKLDQINVDCKEQWYQMVQKKIYEQTVHGSQCWSMTAPWRHSKCEDLRSRGKDAMWHILVKFTVSMLLRKLFRGLQTAGSEDK